MVSRPQELIQGGLGLVARQAVFIDGKYWGLSNVAIELPAVLAQAGLDPPPADPNIALRDQAGEVFYGDPSVFEREPVIYRIELPEGAWEMAGIPAAGWSAAHGVPLLVLRLLLAFLALAVLSSVYLLSNRQQRLRWAVQERTRELSEAMQALEEQRSILRTVVDNIPRSFVAIIESDMTPSLVAGQEFARMGLDPGDFVGVPLTQIFSGHAEEARRYFDQTMAGEDVAFEIETGAGTYLEFRTTPLRLPDGTIPRILVVVENISERKQAELRLRESEENYRTLFEEAADGIAVLDEQNRVLAVNRRLCELLGYEQDELVGTDITRLVHEEDLAGKDHQAAYQALLKGQTLLSQYRLRRKDGSYVYTELNTRMVRPGQFLNVVRDISQRVEAQQALERLNAELEQRVRARTAELRRRVREAERLNRGMLNLLDDLTAAKRQVENSARRLEATNRELESFSYSVSHDLRAPLRAIGGYARILNEDYRNRLDEEGARMLDTIQAEVEYMRSLIDGLLRFARMGQQALNIHPVEMERVVREAFAEQRRLWPEREVDFRLSPLPTVEADPVLIQQVWANLLGNALKFSQTRDPIRIEVGASQNEQEVMFWIKDNGVGFDMDYASKLFTVFQRLHPREEYEGTGVGLALVQRIIHRHGGRIWAEGKVDEGATFFFTLPLSQPPQAARATIVTPSPSEE
ncbi:MAG: PAS domain S-box protein [Caldilineae bacterium]|nr:MAG: PAS domain S-box protein [Caldilineae bacterium]